VGAGVGAVAPPSRGGGGGGFSALVLRRGGAALTRRDRYRALGALSPSAVLAGLHLPPPPPAAAAGSVDEQSPREQSPREQSPREQSPAGACAAPPTEPAPPYLPPHPPSAPPPAAAAVPGSASGALWHPLMLRGARALRPVRGRSNPAPQCVAGVAGCAGEALPFAGREEGEQGEAEEEEEAGWGAGGAAGAASVRVPGEAASVQAALDGLWALRARGAARHAQRVVVDGGARPPPPSRTNWTRLVPPSVLTGHVSSLLPY
jgi:hypothetical protein